MGDVDNAHKPFVGDRANHRGTLAGISEKGPFVGSAATDEGAVPPAPTAAVGDLEVGSSGRPATCAYKDLGAVGYVFEGDATVRCRQGP